VGMAVGYVKRLRSVEFPIEEGELK
jgi:hypothetical protein